MRIYTSRYGNKTLAQRDDLVKVGISLGGPRYPVPYRIADRVHRLMPLRSMLSLTDEAEYRRQYRARLGHYAAKSIRERLEAISRANGGEDLVLLCWEDLRKPGQWCHRRHFAEWWQEQTGEAVEELERVEEMMGCLAQQTMF